MDKKQRSASLHDIMDSETFLGPSHAPHPGVDNPLTALGMFSDFSGSDGDGTERASDVDMEEGRVRERHIIIYDNTYIITFTCVCPTATTVASDASRLSISLSLSLFVCLSVSLSLSLVFA